MIIKEEIIKLNVLIRLWLINPELTSSFSGVKGRFTLETQSQTQEQNI